jgi:hypothetical protein
MSLAQLCTLAPKLPEIECGYRLDRVHWIPQRLIKETMGRRGASAAETEQALWDPRVWDVGCRAHHDHLDGPTFDLTIDFMPSKVLSYANDFGFYWTDRGWRAEYREVAA